MNRADVESAPLMVARLCFLWKQAKEHSRLNGARAYYIGAISQAAFCYRDFEHYRIADELSFLAELIACQL